MSILEEINPRHRNGCSPRNQKSFDIDIGGDVPILDGETFS